MPLRARILSSLAVGLFFVWSTHFMVNHPRISTNNMIEWVQLVFYFLHLPGVLMGFAVAGNHQGLRTAVMMLGNGATYFAVAWFVMDLRTKPPSSGR